MFATRLFLLVLVCTLAALVVANAQYYCGRRLAQTLAILCGGGKTDDDDINKWLGGRYEVSFETLQNIRKDCCAVPCLLEDLLSYCPS